MRQLRMIEWLNDRFETCACDPRLLTDHRKIMRSVAALIKKCGLKAVDRSAHQFDRGYTCVWLLSQSHLSLHSWPEHRFVTVSIEVCSFRGDRAGKLSRLHRSLKDLFKPRRVYTRGSAIRFRGSSA